MFYGRQEFESVETTFRRETLDRLIIYAQDRLKNAAENVEKYIAACREQQQKIDRTEFKKVIILRRRQSYSTKKIELIAYLLTYPDIERGERRGWDMDTRKFTGTERKAAREYARELAAEHGCEIREEGF